MMERETRHRHARDAGVAVGGETPEPLAITRREILQHHQRSARLAGKNLQAGMERLGRPGRVLDPDRTEMTLARRASDHERFHGQKTRKFPPHPIDRGPRRTGHPLSQVLPDEKERLDRAHPVFVILKDDEMVIKSVR